MLKPTTLRRPTAPIESEPEFVRFRQYGQHQRYLCDVVGCTNEARWERPDGVSPGVPLLYCAPCKRKVEEADES